MTVKRNCTLQAEKVSENLEGPHKIKIEKFDKTTGNFAEIISEEAPVPPEPIDSSNYVKRADQYLHSISPALGFGRLQIPEFKMDQTPQVTSSNGKIVHGRQTYQSIDIFQSGTSVRFDSKDAIKGVKGNIITVSQNKVPTALLPVKEAVKITARLVGKRPNMELKDPFGETRQFQELDLTGFDPEIDKINREDPFMTTYYKPGPFLEPIKARMIWFELSPGELRLAWEVITTQKNALQYRTIIDATQSKDQLKNEEDAILYNKVLTQTLLCRMKVYTMDGRNPRETMDCPIPLNKYPVKPSVPLPSQFPDHWNDDNADSTVGNSTYAHLGESPKVYKGMKDGGVLVFDPSDPLGDEQKILNMYYFNCYMHDFFYILGFDEKNFNFQFNNFGRGGYEGDRVDARAHSGPVDGTANMYTPSDGRNPVMNMGLVSRRKSHCFDSL